MREEERKRGEDYTNLFSSGTALERDDHPVRSLIRRDRVDLTTRLSNRTRRT
jgi:hypothetical protein